MASLAICRADPKAVENILVTQETDNTAEVSQMDWHKALHSEFKYTPTTPPIPAVLSEAISETPAKLDVVVLPKYVVRGATPRYREFENAMRSSNKDADKVMEKLGIGVHAVKFRHFSFGCATIFFIPVSLGMSW